MKTKSPAQQLEHFLLVLYKKRELAEIPKALCVSIGTLLCTVVLTPFVVTPLIGLLVAISQPSLNMSIPSVSTALVGFFVIWKTGVKGPTNSKSTSNENRLRRKHYKHYKK